MKRTVGSLGLWLFLVACSSSSSPASSSDHDAGMQSDAHASEDAPAKTDAPTTHDAGPTAASACAEEATAVCKLHDTCAPGYENDHVYGSESICATRTAASCVNALAAKGNGNNPTHTASCAAAYPSEACVDLFDNNPVAACTTPVGSIAMGSACGASGQCESMYCAVTSTTICGTCQPIPAVGASCMVQADCGRDLSCAIPVAVGDAGSSTSGTCAAWVASGGACLTGTNPCEAGTSCVGDDPATMTMGVCMAAGATVGAACQTTRKTLAGCASDRGLVCIPTQPANEGMGTCQAITLVAAGMPCGVVGTPETGFAQCTAGGLCKKAAPTDPTGTCVAAAADGAACDSDPANGPPCLDPAKCVAAAGSSGTAGTCTVPDATTCM